MRPEVMLWRNPSQKARVFKNVKFQDSEQPKCSCVLHPLWGKLKLSLYCVGRESNLLFDFLSEKHFLMLRDSLKILNFNWAKFPPFSKNLLNIRSLKHKVRLFCHTAWWWWCLHCFVYFQLKLKCVTVVYILNGLVFTFPHLHKYILNCHFTSGNFIKIIQKYSNLHNSKHHSPPQ